MATPNKKYYLFGFLTLLGAVIGYHFYAAAEAERQIDKAIQEQTTGDSISVQYSSIDVSPFSAVVTIRDLTIVFGDHIERAQNLQLDISYLDFLNIYIAGIEYGLDHLTDATVSIINPYYVNRSDLEEFKSDEITITYKGNALDGLQSAINGSVFNHDQSIEAVSNGLTVQLPKTTFSKVQASTFRYSGSVSMGQTNFWTNGSHQFSADSLTWTPSVSFQDSYSFFIKGFGYNSNAIPFKSAQLNFTPTEQPDRLRLESAVQSELAVISCSGFIRLNSELENSELENMRLSLSQYSDSFRQVLQNIERLLAINLPKSDNGISVRLEGTVAKPRLQP